ncbi:fumarate hydratase [Candidatus Bipolaricaulota bacterium]|nr:fumarate hydratase [Candidatus Bipolaricaulota bacterium]MCK4681750.1 fumarate hydratase [Candidatus Bipolaricaulota bacterium]
MRKETLKAALVAAIKKAVTVRPSDVVAALKRAREVEEEERARSQLDAILKNIEIARRILSEEELRREEDPLRARRDEDPDARGIHHSPAK